MASFDWFPWYPMHYRRATRHLTDIQDLIYRRLIDEYMETREPLPDNDIALASIARVSVDVWQMARAIVLPFFCQSEGRLSHRRCEEILTQQGEISKKKSRAGAAGAAKRWNKPTENIEENSNSHGIGNTPALANDGTEQNTTEQDSKKDAVDDLSMRVEEIFAWLQQFLNSTSPLFTSPIAAWLKWGADFELDIKPVARRWKQANPQKAIRSLEWLDDDVSSSIRKRSKPMPEQKSEVKGPSHGNHNQKPQPNSVDKRLAALYDAGTGYGNEKPVEPYASGGAALVG